MDHTTAYSSLQAFGFWLLLLLFVFPVFAFYLSHFAFCLLFIAFCFLLFAFCVLLSLFPPPPPCCSSISRFKRSRAATILLPQKLLHHSRRWRRSLGFFFLSAGWNRVSSDVCSLRRSSLPQCPRCSAFLDLIYHLYQVFYLLNLFFALCC